MKAVDVVLHTSTAPEPFGRVIVEGMLARKPVIATRAGGAQEIVAHGETGLLVPPSSPNALARALQTLTADPSHAATLAQHGYEQAARRFSIDAMTEQLDRHLSTLASTR
jgi:glycosyltransferase involved in cell wall biosynthesis